MPNEPRNRALRGLSPGRLIGAIAALAVAGWSYSDALGMLIARWWNEQDYVYGFLVVPFALWLLWLRRDLLPEFPLAGSVWGVAFLLIAGGMRILSAYLQYYLLDPLSLIPCLAGLVLLLAGWKGMRWTWPAIAFLVFMVPLPSAVAVLLGQPLQYIGATSSAYVLQTLGIPATARGTVIVLSQWELGVEEACSGLRMLMLFVTVCTGAAMVLRRDPWERVVLVLSAAPIAVIANVLRITAVGILYEWTGPELAQVLFDRLAGYFMMPLAVLMVWLEMLLLSMLFQPRPEEDWL